MYDKLEAQKISSFPSDKDAKPFYQGKRKKIAESRDIKNNDTSIVQ